MVFIQDIVRGTELTTASGGPQKIGASFWPAAPRSRDSFVRNSAPQARKVHLSFAALARGAPQATGSAEDRQ